MRGGFEPPVRLNPYGSLANCWFQPLTHLTNRPVLPVKSPVLFRTGLQIYNKNMVLQYFLESLESLEESHRGDTDRLDVRSPRRQA